MNRFFTDQGLRVLLLTTAPGLEVWETYKELAEATRAAAMMDAAFAEAKLQYEKTRKAFDAKGLSYIPITVGETGWNVIDPRLSFRAHPVNQKMYFDAMQAWATEGRRSRNVRIVEFDVATGQATKQVIYQLEALADINARTPGTGVNDFSATQQGRSIGVSAILAMGGDKFLILERDNRGVGVDPDNNALMLFQDLSKQG